MFQPGETEKAEVVMVFQGTDVDGWKQAPVSFVSPQSHAR
jgi:hypothetical protein